MNSLWSRGDSAHFLRQSRRAGRKTHETQRKYTDESGEVVTTRRFTPWIKRRDSMEIDVYDFDGTIYDGDSTVDFYLYCLRRHPKIARRLPSVAAAGLRKLFARGYDLTAFKSVFFGFVQDVDVQAMAGAFWQEEATRGKLGAWFQTTPRDLPFVIASASPEFELAPIARELGAAALIATRTDARTGVIEGKNNKSNVKIARIRALYGEDVRVRAMYTDDLIADGPLVAWAREGYRITHGSVQRIK